jgi:hypothetical protein
MSVPTKSRAEGAVEAPSRPGLPTLGPPRASRLSMALRDGWSERGTIAFRALRSPGAPTSSWTWAALCICTTRYQERGTTDPHLAMCRSLCVAGREPCSRLGAGAGRFDCWLANFVRAVGVRRFLARTGGFGRRGRDLPAHVRSRVFGGIHAHPCSCSGNAVRDVD